MKKVETVIADLLKEKRSDLTKVDPRTIDIVEGFNGREDLGDIEELKNDIRSAGEILVNSYGYRDNGRIKLINGHRRNIAARELIESGEMPNLYQPIIIFKGKPTPLEMIKIMVLTNKGKNFTPLEDAHIMQRMVNEGLTPKLIAEEFHKTEAHVCNSLALAKLPAQLKRRISANEISSTLVLNVVRSNKELNIDQITAKVEEILDKSKIIGKKVTKAVIDKEMNKINSISELKKVIKEIGEGHPHKAEKLFAFATALVNNQLTADDIRETFGMAKLVEEEV